MLGKNEKNAVREKIVKCFVVHSALEVMQQRIFCQLAVWEIEQGIDANLPTSPFPARHLAAHVQSCLDGELHQISFSIS